MASQRLVSSTARSTARSFSPGSGRAWFRRSIPAKSLSWTISAVIAARLCREAGAKLFFLPKYSPDLNPIEQVFSKLKHGLRKTAARSYDAVLAAIGELLGS